MDKQLDLVRRCLTLISGVAAVGASVPDPELVEAILVDLTCLLGGSRYRGETSGSPSMDEMTFLQRLHDGLDEMVLSIRRPTS